MKNINDVLRQKERAIAQLQKDIEVLRAAAELLSEDSGESSDALPRNGLSESSAVAYTSGVRQNSTSSPSNGVSYHAAPDGRTPQFP